MVSIHALTRRATNVRVNLYVMIGFNPRPHAEGDPDLAMNLMVLVVVSIHALTRRATGACKRVVTRLWFQSTPSRGGRLAIRASETQGGSFNPRPHAEGDAFYLLVG